MRNCLPHSSYSIFCQRLLLSEQKCIILQDISGIQLNHKKYPISINLNAMQKANN